MTLQNVQQSIYYISMHILVVYSIVPVSGFDIIYADFGDKCNYMF